MNFNIRLLSEKTPFTTSLMPPFLQNGHIIKHEGTLLKVIQIIFFTFPCNHIFKENEVCGEIIVDYVPIY